MITALLNIISWAMNFSRPETLR